MSTLTHPSFVNHKENNFTIDYFEFEENYFTSEIQCNNYYTLIWITKGAGRLKTGFLEDNFNDHNLFAFSPLQPFLILPESPLKGIIISFSNEFIYINKNENEKSYKGHIFDNHFQKPLPNLDNFAIRSFSSIFHQIKTEIFKPSLAHNEMLSAYLKILLINVLRLKSLNSSAHFALEINNNQHYLIQKLNDAIDNNFRDKHSPSEYAEMLNVTVKTLSRICKSHFNRTVSEIINSKIISEAKKELYLTNKTVKEIAFELGYEDEYYFSRFFKINTSTSPKKYRYTFSNSEAILCS